MCLARRLFNALRRSRQPLPTPFLLKSRSSGTHSRFKEFGGDREFVGAFAPQGSISDKDSGSSGMASTSMCCSRSVCSSGVLEGDLLRRGLGAGRSVGFRLQKGSAVALICKKSRTGALQVRAVASTPTLSEDVPTIQTSTSESALILIRHGESLWNQKNLFTGCVDVPLSQEGVEEAIEAGKRISNLPVDIIFTSALIRAQMTAMLAMTQHRMKKVPVILHNESNRAKTWSTIFSSETEKQTIPVFTAWELNERMYGELQGLNKKETADKFGTEKVHEWRRSYDIPPPDGESLAMCAERAVAYFSKEIEPTLAVGKNVLIAAHGNSLRSIIMYLDKLTPQEVIELELSTGVPMLYVFKDGNFSRRGSPISPDSTGPYAFTPDLALYREQLDKMLQPGSEN